jgi:hypothetical protein
VHGGLHEEAHEAELHAMLFLEALLVLVAKLDHRLHVDFVERRQDGGGGLRLKEAFGDTLAQPRHRHALSTIAKCHRQRHTGVGAGGCSGGGRRGGGRSLRLGGRENVAFVTVAAAPVPATSAAAIPCSASHLCARAAARTDADGAGEATEAAGAAEAAAGFAARQPPALSRRPPRPLHPYR